MARLASLCFVGVVSASWLAPAATLAAPGDEAAIRALEARFAAAVNAKSIDSIMKVYAKDVFVFDVTPPRQYVGAAAYREDWKGFTAGFAGAVKFDISDLVVSTDGAIGYGRSIQHVRGTNPRGAKVDITVRVTDVYRKAGGEWRIVQEHVSVPVNLDTGKADLASRP